MENIKLQDIHLPGSASFWPLAWGWWLLLALILLITAWAIFYKVQHNHRKKQQAMILKQFYHLEKKLTQKPSNAVIAEINTLLRQLAVNYYPRAKVASLTGGEWLQFLDQSGNTHEFSRGAGRILIEAPYRSDNNQHTIENLNLNEFIPLIKSWAKKNIRENHG